MKRLFSLHVWVVSASLLSCLSSLQSCICHFAQIMFYSRLDTVRFCCFPHENLCQPSSLQFKFRSIKTRLNWLQTVIDGQKSRRTLDEMSGSHRSRLDTSFCTRWSGSSQLASDKTLSRTACTGAHGAWISCARCALRLHYIPRHPFVSDTRMNTAMSV